MTLPPNQPERLSGSDFRTAKINYDCFAKNNHIITFAKQIHNCKLITFFQFTVMLLAKQVMMPTAVMIAFGEL